VFLDECIHFSGFSLPAMLSGGCDNSDSPSARVSNRFLRFGTTSSCLRSE
jgi:hypothetical protein